jgi:uncharacterized LabA/DUF88 family protein
MLQVNRNLALFCDFENIALGVRDARYADFDIQYVLERLLVKGSIIVKKAYCDWERYRDFRRAMHEAAFELIEIPHVRQSGKNSADIRMVVDALDLCYTRAHVDTFVIISGDSDFSPLVSKLRENARTVIGVGVKNSTSDLLIGNCDEFIFYDDLVREEKAQKRRRRTPRRRVAAGRADARGEARTTASATEPAVRLEAGTAATAELEPTEALPPGDVSQGAAVAGPDAVAATATDVVAGTVAGAGDGGAKPVRRARGRGRGRGRGRAAGEARDAGDAGRPADAADAEGVRDADVASDADVVGAAEIAGASEIAGDADAAGAAGIAGDARPAGGADDPGRSEDAGHDDDAGRSEDAGHEDRLQEAIDLVLETADALRTERGEEETLWGSMVKQALKRRRPGFNESYYGVHSFSELLQEAQARGLLSLELDERSGGYVIRSVAR